MHVPPHSAPWVSPVSTKSEDTRRTFRLPGDIAAREVPLDIGKAGNHNRQALALAEELGMRPLIAQCHVGLGKFYRRIERTTS